MRDLHLTSLRLACPARALATSRSTLPRSCAAWSVNLDLAGDEYVEHMPSRVHTQSLKILDGLLHVVGCPSTDRHGAALPGEANRHGPTDPTAAPRDDCSLAGEPQVHSLLKLPAFLPQRGYCQ